MGRQVKELTEQLVEPILADLQLELVDIEFKKEGRNWFLRVFIDSDRGVDIEDCGIVSEQLSKKLDELDPIEQAYFLEVSSPGAERPLKKEADFKRSIGKHVNVSTYETIDGDKVFEGKLLDFTGSELTIEMKVKTRTVTVSIPYDKIAKARLAVVF
ncbi:MAG TPA: ribosome maturation factor RimP [Bacilli bacterium]|nr:ribosome maturation factor RimP [Bacilli bacterium]